MSKAIFVDGVSMVYSRRGEPVNALEGITLELPAESFGSIIGPSGCGKSTLLRLIADIMPPSSGDISIGGAPPREARREHAIGFVFQAPTLLPWRTLRRNIELPLDIVGSSQARSSHSLDQLIELVGLKGFDDALPHELSGGMQQRVAIARSLLLDPQVLLLDEPFGALDEITRQRMNLELLRIWTASQTTALLVTHSISEAVFMSDVVFVMSASPGRLIGRVDVALPRPRTIDMMRSPEFYDCVNRIRDGLFGSGAMALEKSEQPVEVY
jgi:NitT/TauT family transport system ATP-binding protein